MRELLSSRPVSSIPNRQLELVHGSELGPEGVKEYLETKTITIALNQKNS
jgi:hypothetical protein